MAEGEQHDLLATNWPVPHARDARQFVLFAHAVSGGALSKASGLAHLTRQLGLKEVRRMLDNVRAALRHCDSVALETYWSRGAIRWGDEAVRYFFRPARATPGAFPAHGAGRLSAEFEARLRQADVTFELYVQRFVSEERTPIEDAAHEWAERDSQPILVATLTLPRRDLSTPDAIAERRSIDETAFNPWNTTDEFRPLGNLNRARKVVYDASFAHRAATRWRSGRPPLQNRVFGSSARWALRHANRRVPWHRMPMLDQPPQPRRAAARPAREEPHRRRAARGAARRPARAARLPARGAHMAHP